MVLPRHLGQTEVGDAHLTQGVQEDVGGLDVAVEDALVMGVLQGIADLLDDLDRLAGGERGVADEFLEVGAVHELHEEVEQVIPLAEVEDGDDVGMLEPCQGLRFTLEAQGEVGVMLRGAGEDLERHIAIEPGLPGVIHGTHASSSEQANDFQIGEEVLQLLRLSRRTPGAEEDGAVGIIGRH